METPTTHIVVAVIPGQPAAVLSAAATFAERFGADLVCACVDESRYAIEQRPDGTVVSILIDPDLVEAEVEPFDRSLEQLIADTLKDRKVGWTIRALAGGAAQELAKLADELDAAMIVVGTREAGLKGSLHEFFKGSVAVELAHRQHRPIVVVPLNPIGPTEELPWNSTTGA